MVDDRAASYERIAAMLAAEHSVDVEAEPAARRCSAPPTATTTCVIVSLGLENFDGLRLCSQIRSLDRTRNVPILAIAEADRQCAAAARPRNRRERLSDASDRQERAAGAGAHPGPPQALHRAAARQRADLDRDGDHRRADRPVQSPLHGKPSRDAGRAGGGARQAARRAGARHRLLQGDQRHPRPRRRRRRAARVRAADQASRSAASISPAATAARSSSW